MNEPICFFVEGAPRAKQSFRYSRFGNHQSPMVKAWQKDVAWTGQRHMHLLGRDLLEGRLSLELTFFLPNARRVDSDNLAKCIQDGLNGIVWKDDQQNIDLVIHKYVCRTLQGVLIKVCENDRALEVTKSEALTMIGVVRFTLAVAAFLPSEVTS